MPSTKAASRTAKRWLAVVPKIQNMALSVPISSKESARNELDTFKKQITQKLKTDRARQNEQDPAYQAKKGMEVRFRCLEVNRGTNYR